MNDRAGLLSAILADPADDVARLSYADWLRERPHLFDQGHGRFIAAGLTLDRVREPEEPNEGVFFEALREQDETAPGVLAVQLRHLLGWQVGSWGWENETAAPGRVTATLTADAVAGETRHQRALRRRRPEPRPAVTWERGCVAAARLPLRTWATRGEWVFAHCPIERVELTEVPGLVLTVVRDPVGARGWRMRGELNLARRVGPPPANVELVPAARYQRFVPSYEGNPDGLTRDRAAVNLWDWTDVLLTRLAEDAGDRWPGPPDWPDPFPADVYRGPVT